MARSHAHPGRLRASLVAVVALAAAGAPSAASAAAHESAAILIDWNVNASTAIVGVARQPPHAALISFAMVQGAVYDAVNAIDGGHEGYLVGSTADPSASKSAAAAAAAHAVLVGLLPAQSSTLDAQFAASLAAIPDGPSEDAGVAVGHAAAAAMLEERIGDGRGGPSLVVIGDEPGEWRTAAPGFGIEGASWVGAVRPFLVPSPDTFRSDGPLALTSSAYAEDFAEVKAVGSVNSALRTADQTDAALYWQDHGVALWNRIMRSIAGDQGVDIVEAARLFAMANMAASDAAIGCWNDKYYWNFWRPTTAIREADTDGNPATTPDPAWLPLIGTPPFPEHPSGHGCVSGAIVGSLQAFFGTDKVPFTAFSNNSGTWRSFDRLSVALREIVDARVWGGIHFRTADVQGTVIGRKTVHWMTKHYFGPRD